MPQSRTYTVTQTREVEVHANDPVSATQIANMAMIGIGKAFTSRGVEEQLGVWGYAKGQVVATEMTVKEKPY